MMICVVGFRDPGQAPNHGTERRRLPLIGPRLLSSVLVMQGPLAAGREGYIQRVSLPTETILWSGQVCLRPSGLS